MRQRIVKTAELKMAYDESGPKHGEQLLLLHGWPDSPRTWDGVLPYLHTAGFRTIAPYLRGYGPSRFRDGLFSRQRRTGQPVAYASDAVQLLDRLGIKRVHFIGHDWGAMAGYAMAALHPERLKSLVTISVPFSPGPRKVAEFPQARAFWYQWLLNTPMGEKRLREDPVGYGRAQWDGWSPAGWYTEAAFEEAAKSWRGKDFADVVLHAYRSQYGVAPMDPRYAKAQAKMLATRQLQVPTTLIHGAADMCELPETTEGAGRHFTGGYERVFVDGAGHFPQREDPAATAAAILGRIRSQG